MEKKPVLYAEDNPDDIFFMQTAFKKAGIEHPLAVVDDGQQVMDYLTGKREFTDRQKHPFPSLLLLDLNMPIKSGFDVLRWMKEEPALKDLRVVVVSSSGQQLDIDLAWKMGICDYIIKSPSPQVLIERILRLKEKWLR